MAPFRDTERRLAVVTCWSLCAPFSLAFVISGFSGSVAMGAIGFTILVVGFIAHVIINQYYGTGFSTGETVVGFVAFDIALVSFLGVWIASPDLADARVITALGGFGAFVLCFVVYLVTRYGLKGAFSMFHHTSHH
jgi:hypothetical protein